MPAFQYTITREEDAVKQLDKAEAALRRKLSLTMIVDPESPEYARFCGLAGIVRAKGHSVSISPPIPDDVGLQQLLIPEHKQKEVYALFDEQHGQGLRTVVCGSFRRHLKDVRRAMSKFRELEVQVLSPTKPQIIDELEDNNHEFAILEGDSEYKKSKKPHAKDFRYEQSILHYLIGSRTPRTSFEIGIAYAYGRILPKDILRLGFQNDLRWQIESRHCEQIKGAHFVWVSNPDGYIGNSAAFELGFAHGLGKRIISETPPTKGIFRLYVQVAKNLEEAVAIMKYANMPK